MCGAEIPHEHGHVVDIPNRGLLCTCRGCTLLFAPEGAGGSRYRAVGDRYLSFPSFELGAMQWDRLQIPVSMAFFFHNSQLDRTVAFYPSPGGATESELPLEDWEEILAGNPALSTLEPDVEALLVRKEDEGYSCYLVPIDACYELVGHIRLHWKGFDGGQEVWDRIDAFFDEVGAKARLAPEVSR